MAERQVVFYECQDIDQRPPFDRLKAVGGINNLDDEDWRVPDGDFDLGVIVDRKGSSTEPTRLRLLRIRPDAPYMLSAARQLTRVEVADDENITEFTSVVLWPDNFMAAISSRDAPGHKRLSLYFDVTSDQETHIVNLFRPDVVQRLKVLREHGLRSVQVKVQTSHLQQIEADKDTQGFGQFWKAGKGTDAATIGIELTVGRSGPDATLNNAFGLSAEALAEHIDLLESMNVKGREQHGEIETINMKHERIGVAVDIEAPAMTPYTAPSNGHARQSRKTLGSLKTLHAVAKRVLIRHALFLVVVAALAVFVAEPIIVSGPTPLISGLSEVDRIDLYNQIIVVSAGLLGFIVAAIAILVSLDSGRQIVEELRRGESFRLLIANMLAVMTLLFVLTLMGIAGSVLESATPSNAFETVYEWLLLGTTMELMLVGFFFAVVTYKVAAAK